MSSQPDDDPASQALVSGIKKPPLELKITILELTVYNNRKLVLKLVAKSSLCKQWSVCLDSLMDLLHIVGFLQA
jgi:hypothetical protein